MNLVVRTEDIMTPRRLLRHAADDATAIREANRGGFDAVPIVDQDGIVREFWNREHSTRIPITRRHRVPHDWSIERVLSALGAHVVQFVYYRSEMVGLIDASDLNRPLARMAWLHPMVELERAILDAVRDRKIGDKKQADALGDCLKTAEKRRVKARRGDLELPLLEFAQFKSLLEAANYLKIIALKDDEIVELNEFRKRAAHGAIRAVIEDREDCLRLSISLKTARAAARAASTRSGTGL